MKLSIVIPVYKVEKYVEKCLRSCEEQDISSDEYEIIVINDGSPDKSLEIVERIAKEYDNIHVVSQENQGLSLTRNKGLSLAKGDYIWFVDSDDWIEKNILKKLITHCYLNDLDILRFCPANVINGKAVRRFNYKDSEEKLTKGKDALLKFYNFHVQFSIYKRKFLLENNFSFYPGVFYEDQEFTPRVWYKAQRVMFINDICYYYYINSNSIVYTNNPKKSFDFIKICKSLDEFSETVEDKYKIYFHNRISDGIVRSLDNSCVMDSTGIKELNTLWKENFYLFDHLKMSNKWGYRWRYYLFKTFPYYCQINKAFYYPYRIFVYLTQPKQCFDFLKRRITRITCTLPQNKAHKRTKKI